MNKPYITKVHIILEVLSLILSVASVAYGVAFALKATDPMPTNFNMAGEATGYGSAWFILLTPGIIFITNIVLSLVLHFLPTNKWNVSFKIRPERELAVFECISLMIAVMEFTMALWALVVTMLWASALGSAVFISSIVMAAALIIEAIVFYILAYRRNKI